MVGNAIVRRLASEGCTVLTVDRHMLDLTDTRAVNELVEAYKPEAVFIAAAKVGGIMANKLHPVDFLYDNLMIALNVIQASHANGVGKLLFLGSSSIYPREAPQPITEDALLTGPLEPTNASYALAKIAGIRLVQSLREQYGCNFISAMPTNLYGPNDNFHPHHAHVPAALMSRFHEAKVQGFPDVTIWGTGTPLREFLSADDLADACVFMMKHYDGPIPLNVGTGREMSIHDFAVLMKSVVGYEGEVLFNPEYPDGAPRKVLDVSKLAGMGWTAPTSLMHGLTKMYAWYLYNYDQLRRV